MHVMVDSDVTNEEIDIISDTLKKFSKTYDVVITSSKMDISVYDSERIEEINNKIDIILENMSQLSNLKKEIKYVFGLKNE